MENVEGSESFYAFSYTLCDDTIQLASAVWIPPLKCNIDAAMLDNHMDFGAVIRDHEACMREILSFIYREKKRAVITDTRKCKMALVLFVYSMLIILCLLRRSL
nr:hypothetical protein Iba_chr08cCG4930 [Ipomoea batatas]